MISPNNFYIIYMTVTSEPFLREKKIDSFHPNVRDPLSAIFLIHSADLQSRPVVITNFTHVVHVYVFFSKSCKTKQFNFQ